jgi:uncharacterized protein DUF4136
MRSYVLRPFVGFVALLLFSWVPASAQDITSDFDRAYDFSKIKTFAVKMGTPWGNQLGEKRIQSEVSEALVAKGWKTAPEESADAIVILHGATQTKHDVNTFYSGMGGYGYGGWGYGGGMGTATTTTYEYRVGTLVADIFDAKTKSLVYRGSATDELSDKSDKNIKKGEKAIEKMFKNFPPKPKK